MIDLKVIRKHGTQMDIGVYNIQGSAATLIANITVGVVMDGGGIVLNAWIDHIPEQHQVLAYDLGPSTNSEADE